MDGGTGSGRTGYARGDDAVLLERKPTQRMWIDDGRLWNAVECQNRESTQLNIPMRWDVLPLPAEDVLFATGTARDG